MQIDHYYAKFMGLDQERAVLRELGKNLAFLAKTRKGRGKESSARYGGGHTSSLRRSSYPANRRVLRSGGATAHASPYEADASAFQQRFMPSMTGILIITVPSLMGGVVLGRRFKVWMLIPATVLDLIVTIGVSMAYIDETWLIVLLVAVGISALQIGYVIGLASTVPPFVSVLAHVLACWWPAGGCNLHTR